MATPGRQRGLLTLTINNARAYFRSEPERENRRSTEPVTLCGLRWHLKAFRKNVNGVPHVAAYVYCSSDVDGPWKCKATCILRVVNSVAEDVVRRACEEFTHDTDQRGFSGLLSIENLLKPANGYIKDNMVIIECSVTAFLSPVSGVAQGACGVKRRCTDVKLVAEGREVYANKGVLAASCDYFEALFYGDFDDRNKNEITLDDVKHEDLVAFLEVINPPCAPIDENNIATILRLADRFGAKMFLEKCEKILVKKMKLKDAIIALDVCNSLSDLKAQLLDKITKEDLKSLSEDETVERLSPETAILIMKELRRRLFP